MTNEQQAGQSIRERINQIADDVVARQYREQPDLWLPYGESGREHSRADTRYALTFLVESLEANSPILFIEYVAWAATLFASLRLPPSTLPDTLRWMREAIAAHLSPAEAASALQTIQAAAESLNSPAPLPASFIETANPLTGLAQQYLQALLNGQRRTAGQLITDAIQNGVPIRDIYLQVFQPCQRELGRLWQLNRITVAQEHYCTAATQVIMSQLYPQIFAGERSGLSMVMACVGGELHELGARMVADFFEMAGWDTYFVGANTPQSAVLQTILQRKPDLVAISATMTFHVSRVAALIQAIRASDWRPARIIVGGYPFNLASDLWRTIGADGFAADAEQAIAVASRLLEEVG